MNKLTKVLSVFVLAGAIGTGVAGVAGCSNKGDEHTHDYQYTQITGNAEKHNVHCKNDGHEGEDTQENHSWKDGKCEKCDYPQPAAGAIALPAGTNDLIVEGVTTEYVLSATATSANIPLTGFDVYFATGSTKGDKVPVANWKAELFKGSVKVENTTALKEDTTYTLSIELVNVTGGDSIYKDVPITVKNPITAIALKTGTVEQTQSTTNSMISTWTYEATRANGDEEALAADKVTVGSIDTMVVGSASVTVTLTGTSITTTVNYEIKKDASIVTQSFVVNASNYEDWTGSNGESKVLDATNKVTLTAKSDKTSKINGNAKEFDGKSFTKRIQLAGTYSSGTNTIKLEGLNSKEGLDANATVKTRITVYAISGNSTNKRFISIIKDGEAAPLAGQEVLLDGAEITKAEFEVTEVGTYHIATFTKESFSENPEAENAGSNGGINIYFVQVDKIITGDANAKDIPLEGTLAISSLKLDTEDVKKIFKVGETFTYEGLKVTAVSTNSVTADMKEEVVTPESVVAADMNILGETTVTVSYQGKTATYTITIESAIDGISGVNAVLASSANTIVPAGTKFTLNKADIVVSLVGENAEATIESFIVKDDDNEVTLPAEIGIGTYNYTVVATVKAGGTTITLETPLAVKVEAKADESQLQNVSFFLNADTILSADVKEYNEDKVLVDNSSVKITIKATAGTDSAGKANGTVTIDANSKTAGTTACTHRIKLNGKGNATRRSICLEVKGACKVIVYGMSGSSSDTTRTVDLLASDGTAVTGQSKLLPTSGSTIEGVELQISAAGTYYLTGLVNSINIYGIEIIYTSASTPATASLEALPPKHED